MSIKDKPTNGMSYTSYGYGNTQSAACVTVKPYGYVIENKYTCYFGQGGEVRSYEVDWQLHIGKKIYLDRCQAEDAITQMKKLDLYKNHEFRIVLLSSVQW